MATTFKTLNAKDVISTRNLLHEAIPITGQIVSGTYADNNIKNYSHGIFQSVYDYPYLSSSANHIFDLSAGYSNVSNLSGSTNRTQNGKKINIYNQMAQVLVGFDENNDIRRFDEDGNLTGGTKIDEAYFINLTRLLTKDEIKKGSFTLELGVDQAHQSASGSAAFGKRITLKDTGAINSYKVNSPVGEYGILYAANSTGTPLDGVSGSTQQPAGLIYYQAGVAVVTGSVFGTLLSQSVNFNSKSEIVQAVLSGSTIQANSDEFRHRIYNLSFNNSVELNSTVYFCRANHNEFNYSANPTYLSASKLVVKNDSADVPVSYATTVGLYSPDNELLAVAKLSEPLKKDPTTEFTVRVRLDY
tara:strand:- start:1820 stop:2896 length:1077 start_codon:yes stop_codon:yes gene_type:complete